MGKEIPGGFAGDLGQLVSTRGSEDRGGELGRALRAGEGKEEGDGADRWARRGSERACRGAGGVAGVRDQAVSAAERGERVRAGWAGVRV